MPPHHASGIWEPHLQGSHINILELQAAFNALRLFCSLIRKKHVLIHSDNSTVVAYINHQGSMHSPRLCLLTRQIFLLALDLQISIWAAHIPALTTWSQTCSHVAKSVQPIGLYIGEWWSTCLPRTSTSSRRRRMFSSWSSAPGSSIPSPGHQTLFRSIRQECQPTPSHRYPSSRWFPSKSSGSCAVSSSSLPFAFWPCQPWFPCLMQLLQDPDCIFQQGGSSSPAEVRHSPPYPCGLHLTGWSLSSALSAWQAFLMRQQKWPSEVDASQPGMSTTAGFDILLPGSQSSIWILPRHLCFNC